MPNKLDALKEFVASNPSALWWVEELLIRGTVGEEQGGIVSGGHVVFGLESDAAGARTRQTFGPYPVGDAPGDVPMGKLLGEVVLSQQAAIEAAAANKETALAALAETHRVALIAKDSEHTTAIESERAKVTAKQQELADANTAHTAALAAKEAEKTALQTKLTKAEQDLSELGGEPLAVQRKAEREKAELARQAESFIKQAKEKGLDVAKIYDDATKVEAVAEEVISP
jgi:hypothetical protein